MTVSFVIPLFNEEENVRPLIDSLERTIEHNRDVIANYEIIMVDDGSTDGTSVRLCERAGEKLKLVRLPVHKGQSWALKAGFDAAGGDVVVTVDADLQFDLSDIRGMLLDVRDNADCVCAVRYKRRDSASKMVQSMLANGIRRMILHDPFTDIGCPLRVFKRVCVRTIPFFDGFHRFLPVLILWDGYRVKERRVSHFPRRYGVSKYGFWNRFFQGIGNLLYVIRHVRRKNRAACLSREQSK